MLIFVPFGQSVFRRNLCQYHVNMTVWYLLTDVSPRILWVINHKIVKLIPKTWISPKQYSRVTSIPHSEVVFTHQNVVFHVNISHHSHVSHNNTTQQNRYVAVHQNFWTNNNISSQQNCNPQQRSPCNRIIVSHINISKQNHCSPHHHLQNDYSPQQRHKTKWLYSCNPQQYRTAKIIESHNNITEQNHCSPHQHRTTKSLQFTARSNSKNHCMHNRYPNYIDLVNNSFLWDVVVDYNNFVGSCNMYHQSSVH